ncbi:MAG: FCD domain-containing protein [Betaproteobacteria bacterium]|nr:FCD domain-containing protein [Betaproteobacteria bacterium]
MAISSHTAKDDAANARTLANQAQDLLRRDILSGTLAPGERLRTKELQARYGLGLSPLRESLQRLSAEGMVVNDAQRGFAVAPVSVAELRDLTVARTALESTMLPMAMQLGGADWEGDIVAAFHRLSRTPLPNDPAAMADASLWELRHRSFHHALVAGCGSPWLLRLHGQLVDQSERYRKIRILHHLESQAQVRDVNAEHQAVMDAVLRRDAAQAVALMTQHLVATSDATARLMAPQLPQETTR